MTLLQRSLCGAILALFCLACSTSAADPDRDPAVLSLKEELQADPHRLETVLALGEAYRRQGTIEGRRAAGRLYVEATRTHPDNAALRLAHAQLRVEQGFPSNAARLFRTVLELEPGSVEAHFGLARIALTDFRRFLDRKYLDRSLKSIDAVLALDPGHRDALFFKAFARHQAGDTAVAAAAVHRLIRTCPDDPWGYLVQVVLSMESGREYEAEWALGKAMARVEDAELAEAFATLLHLDALAEENRLLLAGAERARFLTDFWKMRDPTPATPINERWLEHTRRIVTADLLYGIREKRIRGWSTAPGEAIIRYGTPVGRAYGVGSRNRTGFAPPGLLQTHSIGGRDVSFLFEDRNLSGFWVQPFNGGQPTAMDVETSRQESIYDRPRPGPPLPYFMQPAQFRGSDGGTRVELLLGVADPEAGRGDLRRRVTAYRGDWTPLMNDIAVLDPARGIRDRKSADGRTLVDQLTFQAPAGVDSVTIGSQLSDRRTRGFGAGMEPLRIRRFENGVLDISDIVLMDRVGFGPTRPGSGFARPGGWGLPNPSRIYASGENVPVYFEAYGLARGADGLVRYALNIRVEDAGWKNPRKSRPALFDFKEPDRPVVDARFEETAADPELHRLLDIAVGVLAPGRYRLTITVEDQVAAKEVSGAVRFRVVDAPDRAGKER